MLLLPHQNFQMMKKIITWLKTSNRWKHLVGGILIGACADTTYCAAYSSIGIAASLELKDKLWGGKWDWVDFGLTILGSSIGRLIRIIL